MFIAPYIPHDLFVGKHTNNNNINNSGIINYLLVEFIGKKTTADQIDFLTNDMSSINDMISFLENTISITSSIIGTRRFDVHYNVIKESANIWEGRLIKEFNGNNNNKGFTTNQKSKLIKLMEDSVLMKNKGEFMENKVTAVTTRALLLLMIEDDVPSQSARRQQRQRRGQKQKRQEGKCKQPQPQPQPQPQQKR